ncbi:MAG: hypothetical protein JXA25_09130 [Anaerolineales bacterium]|nr:hypothetical protein [Anaerolineales bacterium]
MPGPGSSTLHTLKTPFKPAEPIPLPEYPRPQMSRPDWQNLNGWWEYAVQPQGEPEPDTYDGRILVPFPIESALSGVEKPLQPDETLWYRRTFTIPDSWQGQTVLLHFGAVDYECEVFLNKTLVGSHRGGYLPFTFDITAALTGSENHLIVAVQDPTDTGLQQRGKQVLNPQGIWYTSISGIWQTVWLEPVPGVSINQLKLTPDIDTERLRVEVTLRGHLEGLRIEAVVLAYGRAACTAQGPIDQPLLCSLPGPRLWSPEDPFLYDLHIRLLQENRVVDEVSSYAAMRSFSLLPDRNGHLRFAVNGKPLFLYGPLDQGYFPDGLYTPPSDEAMLLDIEYTRQISCNMIRKHIKVEPLRWYYHCDRLGLIVWQDMPNGGEIDGEFVAIISMLLGFHRDDTHRLKRFGRFDPDNRAEFKTELKGLIDHLYNAPCIAVWVPFNESWGQFTANEIGEWVKSYDPTRLVDHASGWFDQGGGDFVSKHVYVRRLYKTDAKNRAFVLSEFGGYSLKISSHVWNPGKKFGYRHYESKEELAEAYQALLKYQLVPLIPEGLTAAIYTQTTDVEIEINGFLTYDRKVEKFDREELYLLHRQLYDTFNKAVNP